MAVKKVNDRIIRNIEELKEKTKTIILSTVNEQGEPHISYSPFALLNGAFYIFISTVAKHSSNLKSTGLVSLMIIEDESQTRLMYARCRLVFNAKASEVEYNSAEWKQAIQALRDRHGKIVEDLVTMGDFGLFKLVPVNGRFVQGFGQAYELDSSEVVAPVHLNIGHNFNERSKLEDLSIEKADNV